MSEETKEQPQAEETLDEIVSGAPVLDSKSGETKETQKQTEKTEGTESSNSEVEKWREDSENKKKWQGELTRKSQLVSSMTDDEVIAVQSHRKLMEELKDLKLPELPTEVELKIRDDFGEVQTVKVRPGEVLPREFMSNLQESIRNQYINEVYTKIADGEKAKREADEMRSKAEANTAAVQIREYFEKFPDAGFDLGDNPVEAIKDVQAAGKLHPDYDKLLNLQAVAQRSATKGISMEQAHHELFGKSDQTKKANQTIAEEQRGIRQETPTPVSARAKPDEDDEFYKVLTEGQSDIDVFK